jgi:hypothetical protein
MNSVTLAIAGLLAAASSPRPVEVQFVQGTTGRTVTIMIDGRQTRTTFAGKLGFRERNRSWQSVCGNVRAPMTNGSFFRLKPLSSKQVGGRIALAGNIVAKYFASARTADQCAGLQLAVWEAVEDGGDHADFSTGQFRAAAPAAAMDYAQDFYEAITDAKEAAYLESQDSGGQDQFSTT